MGSLSHRSVTPWPELRLPTDLPFNDEAASPAADGFIFDSFTHCRWRTQMSKVNRNGTGTRTPAEAKLVCRDGCIDTIRLSLPAPLPTPTRRKTAGLQPCGKHR